MNFYSVTNASKLVSVGTKKIKFDPCEYMTATHSWWGTYKTDAADEIAALDALASKGVVEKITEDDFNLFEVKKKNPSGSLNLIISSSAKGFQEPFNPVPAAGAAANLAEATAPRSVETMSDILTPKKGRKAK